MKQTDLKALQALAISFLNLEPKPIKEVPLLVTHPFIDSRIVGYKNNEEFEMIDIFDQPEKFEKVKLQLSNSITNGTLETIFARMLNKYHLSFLKYAKPYMSKRDFERFLAYAWVASENPNQDINVSIPELISWFKTADRKNLMEKEELNYYNALPEEVNIYRGIAVGRAEQQGLSWTCNYETAKWFSQRFDRADEKGYIIKGKIAKKDIFAYLNGRNEDEILCNSSKVMNKEIIKED